MAQRLNWALHLLLLIALCGVLYFPYLGRVPFFDRGEPREALAVQDIVERGEWLFPLKRATTIPSKPPLFHWSAALTSQIAGKMDEATIRFPSALYATLGVLVIYALGRPLFGAQVALLGGAILATTLVYQNHALSARVDMTLCFFVTVSLALYYAIYRGFLIGRSWHYVFYILIGIGTLAKGPLGIVLPGLVIVLFLALKRRWDLVFNLCFHPAATLTLLLAGGWYAIAIARGGEDFFERQILGENLARFVGGSGHSHPVYYYIFYLFTLGFPWSLFLPFLLWDSFKQGFTSDEDRLFLKLWFLAMFIFFSLSLGKRPVYLLPLYPALSLLLAVWFHNQGASPGARRLLIRFIAAIAGLLGLVLFITALGAMWNHDPGWFFGPIERLLKPKDRATLLVVEHALATFGWPFTIVSILSGILWLSLAYCLWEGRLRSAAHRLVFVSILLAFVAQGVVVPVIAEARSYRAFMEEVNQRLKPGDRLYLYGRFLSDAVFFYGGGLIENLEQPPELIAARIGPGNMFLIMGERMWHRIRSHNDKLPEPLLKSKGTGPLGNAHLVLVQADGL